MLTTMIRTLITKLERQTNAARSTQQALSEIIDLNSKDIRAVRLADELKAKLSTQTDTARKTQELLTFLQEQQDTTPAPQRKSLSR